MDISIFKNIDVLLLEFDNSTSPQDQITHIADVCFGAGPGGGDYRSYELEFNDEQTEWTLWISAPNEWEEVDRGDEEDSDEVLLMYSLQARAETERGADSYKVACEMLKTTWIQEPEVWDTDLSLLTIDREGLLSKTKLLEIGAAAMSD